MLGCLFAALLSIKVYDAQMFINYRDYETQDIYTTVFFFERTNQIEQKYNVCTKIISSTEENCFQLDNNEKCLSISMISE